MEVLSVNRIWQQDKNTSSRMTDAKIFGQLRVHCTSTAEYEQGTILLVDANTQATLVCHVDQFHHTLNNRLVTITQWNYIIDTNHTQVRVLEFELQHAYGIGLEINVVEEIALSDAMALASMPFDDLSLYTLDQLEHCEPNKPFHVVARVMAKSPLYVNEGRAQFFLHVGSLRHNVTACIVFDGIDLIPYYHNFQMEEAYAFFHLDTVTFLTENHQHGLLFMPVSKCHHIHSEQYDTLPYANTKVESAGRPSLTLPLYVDTSSVTSYTGTVTRVIDTMFGIYELDKQLILCLFHYANSSPLTPYRIATKIRIFHAHMVSLGSSSYQSWLLEHGWKAPWIERGEHRTHIALVACVRSHVQTLLFPDHLEIQQENDWVSQPETTASQLVISTYIDCIQSRADFPALLRKLEFCFSTYQKFPNLPVDVLLDMCSTATRDFVDHGSGTFGNTLQQFLNHEGCSVLGALHSSNTVDLYTCPPLDWVIDVVLHAKEARPLESAVDGAIPVMEASNVRAMESSYDHAGQRHWVVGLVDGWVNGHLYFSDHSTKIALILQMDDASEMPMLGDLCRIKNFRIIQEDLSYNESHGERIPLFCTYIVCSTKDLVRLIPDKEARPRRGIQMTQDVDPFDVTSFSTETRLETPLAMLYIVETEAPVITLDTHNDVITGCGVRVIYYSVGLPRESESESTPQEIAILLDSLHLRQLPLVRRGSWVGLVGDLTRATPPTEDNTDEHPVACYAAKDTLFVPVFHSAGEAIATVTPRRSQTPNHRLSLSQPPCYQVSDLLAKNKDTSNVSWTVFPKEGLFEALIDVEGILIAKEFRFTDKKRFGNSEEARKLYHDLHVGTGHANRTLFLRLRQKDGLDTIDIYLNTSQRVYPMGLVPGALVTFRRLARKKSNQSSGFYGQVLPCTTVTCQLPERHFQQVIDTDQIPQKSMTSLFKRGPEDDSVFQSVCSVNAIVQLTLYWYCNDCESVVTHNICNGLCNNASRAFVAKAQLEIGDGTAEAVAFLDASQLVFELLMLQPQQIERLKAIVLEHGRITYSDITGRRDEQATVDHDIIDQDDITDMDDPLDATKNSETIPGLTLAEACRRVSRGRQFRFYSKRIGRKRSRTDHHVEGALKRQGLRDTSTDISGERVHVIALDRIYLRVVKLQPVDLLSEVWHLLHE